MERTLLAAKAPTLADWALSRGLTSLASVEIARLLDIPRDQVRTRLHAPARRAEWVMPMRGLWIPVAPEYRTWGAPPGIEIIDAMMEHVGAQYYVGWLTAAALHGAAHHAPQSFQVAVDRQVRDRLVGRTRFEFAQRAVGSVPVIPQPTRSGRAWVSSVAATALDIATDVARGGGIDNVATVLIELAELDAFDPADVARLAHGFPVAAGRRIGYVLDRWTDRRELGPLRSAVREAVAAPSRLDPHLPPSGPVDRTWMVYMNRELEPDA